MRTTVATISDSGASERGRGRGGLGQGADRQAHLLAQRRGDDVRFLDSGPVDNLEADVERGNTPKEHLVD